MSNKQRRRQGTGKTHILDQLRGTNAEGKHEWPNVPSSRQDCLRPHRCRCTVCAHLFWWLSRVPSRDSPCLSTHDLFERSFILPKYKPCLSIYSSSCRKCLDCPQAYHAILEMTHERFWTCTLGGRSLPLW